MLMFIVSNLVGSSIQITTLPLPVLSTLQASGLVFNSICATLILGEPFTRWSLCGTLLVCAGAVLIATFGAIGEPAHSLDQLLALLGRRQFLIWMVATAVVVIAVILGAKSVKWMNPRGKNTPRMRLLRGMAYGSISGILSAHSLLVAKSAVELLVRTVVDRHNQFNRWQSWIILLSLLLLALTQLYYLHRGLKLCSTIPQTPLTPGMGFVDDSESDNTEAETSLLLGDDEEAVQPHTSNGKIPRTPTGKSRKGITETEEILEELDDDTLTELFSPGLSHHRRSSARSTPSKGMAGVSDDGNRADESTALLGRTSTGRSYKDRRRRRGSDPIVGNRRKRHGSENSSQEWWKMRWWRSRDGKRAGDDSGDECRG
ncbi:MAG: hypothetical protein Q9185_003872 [Variospora sp. 1 TL-2023]